MNGLGTAWPPGPSFVPGTGLVAILGYARPVSLWGCETCTRSPEAQAWWIHGCLEPK